MGEGNEEEEERQVDSEDRIRGRDGQTGRDRW